MAIADRVTFWTSRMNGENPTSLLANENNEAFTATGAGSPSASGGAWRVSNKVYHVTPTTNEYTLVTCFKYVSAPNDDETIMFLDNGTHSVRVQKTTGGKVKLVGATTATSEDLDPTMAEDIPVPLMLRLTLTSAGVATLYMREIIEDDDGANHYLQVNGTNDSSGTKKIQFGNTNGTIDWNNVYVTKNGAYSPDELALSGFTQDTLIAMGFETVQTLKDSKRVHLKNMVDDSSIVYGFDVSNSMVSRIRPPSIHVFLTNVNSPEFQTLTGSRIVQMFDVEIFITTRGTNYINAYRMGAEIAGDCFDELYKKTGLEANSDSIVSYEMQFNTKMDDDDVVCVHRLVMRYMRRLNMLHR
tara:strand:- start:112 stop:1182 length:1071 start_codon:yes stop_codon:yes gene_type:complete